MKHLETTNGPCWHWLVDREVVCRVTFLESRQKTIAFNFSCDYNSSEHMSL